MDHENIISEVFDRFKFHFARLQFSFKESYSKCYNLHTLYGFAFPPQFTLVHFATTINSIIADIIIRICIRLNYLKFLVVVNPVFSSCSQFMNFESSALHTKAIRVKLLTV